MIGPRSYLIKSKKGSSHCPSLFVDGFLFVRSNFPVIAVVQSIERHMDNQVSLLEACVNVLYLHEVRNWLAIDNPWHANNFVRRLNGDRVIQRDLIVVNLRLQRLLVDAWNADSDVSRCVAFAYRNKRLAYATM